MTHDNTRIWTVVTRDDEQVQIVPRESLLTYAELGQDDDPDTGLPAGLALGAGILTVLVALLWLFWGVLAGVSR